MDVHLSGCRRQVNTRHGRACPGHLPPPVKRRWPGLRPAMTKSTEVRPRRTTRQPTPWQTTEGATTPSPSGGFPSAASARPLMSVHLRADAFQHPHADVLVGHFAAAEAQRHLDLVALLDERLHGAHLHLIVVLIDVRANLDLFDFDDFLLLFGFVLLLLLFVFELAEIQDLARPADRRSG